MDNEILNIVKGTPNILGQVYTDLAQPSVQAVGNALGTVFEFSTSILLPIKLLNEKFKLNFTQRLNEYKDKLEKIPEEKRCEVHPQIGTPIIEKLTYTTNEEISDLFTTLLANASNTDMVHTAHPSFVNIIERLSPDEARIIRYLKNFNTIPYIDVYIESEGSTIIFQEHLNTLHKKIELEYNKNIGLYLDNLTSLGILVDKNDSYINSDELYNDIINEFDVTNNTKQKLGYNISNKIQINKCYYELTNLGKLFIKACVK